MSFIKENQLNNSEKTKTTIASKISRAKQTNNTRSHSTKKSVERNAQRIL